MTPQEFCSYLFEIRINAHVAHLQNRSFAAHKALDELYTGIVDHTDAFIESYQGQYGIITGYNTTLSIKENLDIKLYLNTMVKKCKEFRETMTEGYLQQLVDNIIEFLYNILFKIRFLS